MSRLEILSVLESKWLFEVRGPEASLPVTMCAGRGVRGGWLPRSSTKITPGVELHLRDDLPKLKPAELRRLLERLEVVLRRNI